ncbi:uncharacterized protein LOC110450679 [Mizuhopecten yessoensis]|uniref:uncharacterized protein LOC110450679 n=1 Tax=Mizuhopecten yessoensis TaxID=6573 RepID=UPI000B45C0F8|nr:uncharacterized protein LOC110450679 [Mizuhopecten yessoensis]
MFFFYNAAGTYFLAKPLIDYLQNSKSTVNFTQNLIFEGLKNVFFLDICRCLGLVSKAITEPYWRLAGGAVESALDMGPVYVRLLEVLSSVMENPNLLLTNNIRLFPGPCSPVDDVHTYLLSENVSEFCPMILQKLCHVLKLKGDHLVKDFLPGGSLNCPSAILVEKSKSCPPHNITVERLMAKVDRSMKCSPNITINTLESNICYTGNKTGEWLKAQPEPEQKHIISNARLGKKHYIKTVKERKEMLRKSQLEIFRNRTETVQKKKEKQRKAKDEIVQNLDAFGLWDSIQKIDLGLQNYTTKTDKKNCFKKTNQYVQINI